jgi:hypothetical protein
MFIINIYNIISGIIIFLPVYALKINVPDLFNQKVFHSFSNNVNLIYNCSFTFSCINLLFEITKFDIFGLLCHISTLLIANEYIEILIKLNPKLNHDVYNNIYNMCIFLSLVYFNSFNSYLYTFHIFSKFYEFMIFYLLFNLSYNEQNFEQLSFENKELFNFYNRNIIDIKYFSYKSLSFYILNTIILLLTVNNPQINLLLSIFTSIGLNYFNYTILAHINIYYLLQNDNQNDIIQPPSTPKFKTI